MAKRTNRTAWGLAVVLAVVLVSGIGVMLTHGITLGSTNVQVVALNRWDVGTARIPCCVAPSEIQMTSLGLFAVLLDRRLGPAPDPTVMHLLHEWGAKRTTTTSHQPAH